MSPSSSADFATAAHRTRRQSASALRPPWRARDPISTARRPWRTLRRAFSEPPSGRNPSSTSRLQRATDDLLKLDDVRPKLAQILTSALPDVLTDEVLKKHPLAVWTELAIGLEDAQELKRKKPIPFEEAVALLSKDSGVDREICRSGLETIPDPHQPAGNGAGRLREQAHSWRSSSISSSLARVRFSPR